MMAVLAGLVSSNILETITQDTQLLADSMRCKSEIFLEAIESSMTKGISQALSISDGQILVLISM